MPRCAGEGWIIPHLTAGISATVGVNSLRRGAMYPGKIGTLSLLSSILTGVVWLAGRRGLSVPCQWRTPTRTRVAHRALARNMMSLSPFVGNGGKQEGQLVNIHVASYSADVD